MVVIILVKKFQNGRPWKDSTSSPPKDEIYRDLLSHQIVAIINRMWGYTSGIPAFTK